MLGEFSLRTDQVREAVTFAEPIRISGSSRPLLFAEAPIDQSWVFLECELVGSDGKPAAEFFVNLAYYHGVKDGQPWSKGSPFLSMTLPSPGPGNYQLRVKGTSGPDSAGTPVKIRIHSGMGTVRLMTAATALVALTGFALLLRGFVPGTQPEIPGSSKPQAGRYLFLDGLRGVAVLCVLICHFFVPDLSSPAPYLEKLLSETVAGTARHGDLGVEIFFVLSGFVIAHTLGNHAVTPRFAARFIVRRAVRLDPPYYVALGLMLVIVALYRHDGIFGAWREYSGWRGASANLFYLQDLLHFKSPLDISWTLCLEIQFYLALVVLRMFATLVPRHADRWLFGLVLAMVLASLARWYPLANRFDFTGTWFRFGLGVITYLAFRGKIPRIGWAIPVMIIIALGIYFKEPRGIVAALTAVLIFVAGLTGKLRTWLSNRPIQFFGRLSYSIYLIHIAAGICISNFLWECMEPTPAGALLVSAIGIGTSIGGAILIHHLFEKPGIAISHRLK